MTDYPSRDLHGPSQERGVRDLLQNLFLAELLSPSRKLWLTFAWISDVEILDNSARRFTAIEPDWPASKIRLSQVLDALLARGAQIALVIRETKHNEYFLERMHRLRSKYGANITWAVQKDFHAKGMLGDDYFLSGSMNLTQNGITVNDEHLIFRTDPAAIAQQYEQLDLQWGGLVQ